MKYLFDTLTKNTLTLARMYRYTREGDEFKVYDPVAVPVDHFDVELLSHLENENDVVTMPHLNENDIQNVGNIMTYTGKIDDSRKMLSALDFNAALEWCDEYVCMADIDEYMLTAGDAVAAQSAVQELFDRIMAAMNAGKKIYLGNLENSEFRKVAEQYQNYDKQCHITAEKMNELKAKAKGEFLDPGNNNVFVTLMVSTSGSAGKMSSCMQLKNSYEKANGEKVCIIMTEEICPFLDTEKHNIVPFIRNLSDLSFDEECNYLRYLISNVIAEKHPNRIIIVSQGSFSFFEGSMATQKPLIINNMLWSIITCDSVAICASWKDLPRVEELIRLARLSYTSIDAIFISPLNMYSYSSFTNTFNVNGASFKVNSVGEVSQITSALVGFMLQYPEAPLVCGYMNITSKLNEYIKTDEFFQMYKSYQTFTLLDTMKESRESLLAKSGNMAYASAIGEDIDFDTIDESLIDKNVVSRVKSILSEKVGESI